MNRRAFLALLAALLAGSWPKRSVAERRARVWPTDYGFPPGDVRRYGAVGNGESDDTAALAAAMRIAQAGT